MPTLLEYGTKIKVARRKLADHIEVMEAKLRGNPGIEPSTAAEWADAKRDTAITIELSQQYIDLLAEMSSGLDSGEITL